MKISIIIPVYNEEKTIAETLEKVIAAPVLQYEKEIIVVNDGSRDGTGKILQELQGKTGFTLLENGKNFGKGSSLRTGIKAATGDLITFQDADLEYNPQEYEKMIAVLENGADVVYGSRNLNPKRKGYFHYVIGAKILDIAINLIYGSKLTDAYTCYKLFRAEILKGFELQSRGFEIEAEMTTKALKKGYRIKEVAIDYFPRKFTDGKKIKAKDGLIGLWTILKNKFIK